MRFLTIGKYNTWYDWRLTLTSQELTPPEPKTNYIELGGANGTLDLTEALTGEVAYADRTYKATFWTSEGTYSDRLRVLQDIVNAVHGQKVPIVLPDDPDHYLLGRVRVKAQVWDQVHAEVEIEAICDPWLYAVHETERRVEVSGTMDVVVNNGGRKTISPVVTVSNRMSLTYGGRTVTLSAGTYQVTDLRLSHGANVISVTGYGTLTFTYREASLQYV